MARLTGAFDWQATVLGPIDRWPAALKTVAALMLSSPFPKAILWGPDRIILHNDAFLTILGEQGVAIGRPATALWPHAQDRIGPACDRAFAGESVVIENLPMAVHRHGSREQAYFNFSYIPIRDEHGRVAGLLNSMVETTGAVRVARHQDQLHFLEALNARMEEADGAAAVFAAVTAMVGEHLRVTGCTYADLDPDQDRLTIRGDWAVSGAPGMPGQYRISQFGPAAVAALHAGRPYVVDDVAAEVPPEQAGPFEEIGIGACIAMPLMKGGRLAAVIGIYDRGPRHWTDYERSLLPKVIGRCWAHVDRRRVQDQLHRAQEAGGVGLFSIDIENDLVHATPAFCRIFGLPESDAIPTGHVERLVVPEDRDLVSDRKRRVSGHAALATRYRIRRPDTGEIRMIARKGEFEYDASGRPVRLLGAVRDVTEQDAVERALAESEERFRTLADSMPVCIWTVSKAGKLEWCNAWTYGYTGCTAESLAETGLMSLVHEDDREMTVAHWTSALESGRAFGLEFRIRCADGAYRWQMSHIMPMLGEGGSIKRWLGATTDIHAQKQAEARSARDRDRIWAMSQDLLLVIDRSAAIADVNPTVVRLLGWEPDALIGRPLLDLVAEEDGEQAETVIQQLLLGHPSAEAELAFRTSEGGQRQIAWNFMSEGGALFGFGRDITDQRAVEEALRQSQKMEAVGRLTGGIAHDFNNLLQGISGNLELLGHRLEQGRMDGLERFLQGAASSASRASALTHRLLAFSRRQPLDPRPVEANPLIASMDDLLRRTLGEQIELDMALTDGLWLTRCDPNQLESALLNLAINARDAMPTGGRLVIETGNSTLGDGEAAFTRDVQPGDYVCIRVTDSGTGMDARTLARAFEPFFTTKPIGQGTGLGLSMIYGFTRQSEGFARIDSEAGQGTSVALYLPRYRGDRLVQPARTPTATAPLASANESILVVEDQPVVRSLVVEVLAELGYQVLEAADGFAGLKILQSDQRVDLLLTDIGLPGLDGRQVAEAGRRQRPGLRVLFMTGYAENAALSQGFLETGMAMITKPFANDALVHRVRDMIGG